LFALLCPLLYRIALPVVQGWCRYRPTSHPPCIKIFTQSATTTKDAGPYMQDFGYELRRMGERRSSLGEFPIWLAARTRTSIMDEGSSSECLTAGSSCGDHACSPSKGRPRARSRSLRCFPPDLEDPVRHASSDGSVSRTSVSGTHEYGAAEAALSIAPESA
jgi:hypothetical protein